MDTLFRLVSLQSSDQQHHQHQQHHQQHHQQQQQSSFNSSRTSSSSKSSKHQYPNPNYGLGLFEQEECYHLYMDEEFSSSSSSKQFPSTTTTSTFSHPPPDQPHQTLNLEGRWASELLLDCARAVAARDSPRVQHLMWMLNELSSPYGDAEQKLASYFLQGLFGRLTASGPATLRTLSAASDRASSFDSTRRVALRFQELSPWHSFGHVAANGAILETFLSSAAPDLHILDLSNTFCTQWPTLLEALATRSADDTPHLTITTVVPSTAQRVMKEVASRMEKFARLMGVPFRFTVVHHDGDLSTLDLSALDLSNAALAVNCVNALRTIPPAARKREAFMAAVRRLRPMIVTVVEEEAEMVGGEEDFVRVFEEGVRFYGVYMEALEESFPRASNEKLALERAAGRGVVDLVACPAAESGERRERSAGWEGRMRAAGFSPAPFSDDVADDVRALLRRYREGWSMTTAAEGSGGGAGVFLSWKETPVVWASAWRA